jgi:hypothetical protein
MSVDFQLSFPCPHILLEEYAELNSDRRTLSSLYPMSSEKTLLVRANDELDIPSSGLYSTPTVISTKADPFFYDVDQRVGTIETDQKTYTITLPKKPYITIKEALVILRKAVGTDKNVLFSDENGFLRVSSTDGYLVVRIPALGFTKTIGSQRKELFPSWTLSQDQSISFNRNLQTNAYFKINYITPQRFCPRCGGTGMENDVRIYKNGELITIENENLLYQMTLKALLTDKGSNPYHVWYGSLLKSQIGKKQLFNLSSIIYQDVLSALEKVQDLQKQQVLYQNVSLKEQLSEIVSVDVYQDENDLLTYYVDVEVRNASNELVDISIVFTTSSNVIVR